MVNRVFGRNMNEFILIHADNQIKMNNKLLNCTELVLGTTTDSRSRKILGYKNEFLFGYHMFRDIGTSFSARNEQAEIPPSKINSIRFKFIQILFPPVGIQNVRF